MVARFRLRASRGVSQLTFVMHQNAGGGNARQIGEELDFGSDGQPGKEIEPSDEAGGWKKNKTIKKTRLKKYKLKKREKSSRKKIY